MRCWKTYFFLLAIAYSGVVPYASAQIVLSGMVADSASMQALPMVNLVSTKTGKGTATDLRGGFQISLSAGDSIIFSRVGYHSKTLPVNEVRKLVIVFLKEEHRILNPVEIRSGAKLYWLPEIPPESAWKNPTQGTRFTDVPGFQGVQTFGPGYMFRGLLSRCSRDEKEKRKLARVREENYLARDYVSIVNDPDVKGKIMEEHQLSEEQYYDLLALFNKTNQDIIYRLESHEVIALLLKFYAEHMEEK